HLQGLGVRPETLVGLCLTRSLEMVIGMLGILKAGGAYVPLDPNYPKERLALLLAETPLRLLLTQQRLLGLVPASAAQVLCLERILLNPTCGNRLPLANGITAGNLSHVLYTSGSTGRPKGVALQHRGVVNLLHWAQRQFAASERAGVLAST